MLYEVHVKQVGSGGYPLTTTYRSRWNQDFLATLEDHTLEMVQGVMRRIPGIDARTAHVLVQEDGSEVVVDTICKAIEAGLVTPRFVEAYAKGPNVKWSTLVGYWAGLFPDKKDVLLKRVTDSLAEAAYSELLENKGAEVELQWFVGKKYIDLRVQILDPIAVDGVAVDQHCATVRCSYSFGPSTSLSIDVKAYSSAYWFEDKSNKIKDDIRVGKINCRQAAIATVSDYWTFKDKDRRFAADLVSGEGAALLTADWARQDIQQQATVILTEGQKLHER